eukprot:2736549-Rhodomonas_salina.1
MNYYFDWNTGATEYQSAGSVVGLSLTGISMDASDYSFMAWFYFTSLPSSTAKLFRVWNADGIEYSNVFYVVQSNSAAIQLVVKSAIRTNIMGFPISVVQRKWFHLACSFSYGGYKVQCYMDGVLVMTQTALAGVAAMRGSNMALEFFSGALRGKVKDVSFFTSYMDRFQIASAARGNWYDS